MAEAGFVHRERGWAVELERLLPVFDRRFELLREWLAEVGDPETAADSLEEMGRLLRSALGSPEGK